MSPFPRAHLTLTRYASQGSLPAAMWTPMTRSRVTAALLLAAFLLPVAYAAFVDHGKMVRWWGGATLLGIWAVQWLLDRRAVARGQGGDPAPGLTLFVEPVAWLALKWGFRRFLIAAQMSARPGRVELFGWSSGWRGFLVLPDLVSVRRNLRHARRLADRLQRQAAEHPGSPIRLVTYSSGGFIALEALRRLPQDVQVDRLVMLAPTVSPGYDLGPALQRCREAVCVCSKGDFLINGLGAMVFGTNDRRHTVSAGMLGFDQRPGDGGGLRHMRWRAADIRRLWFAGHFTVSSVPMLSHLIGGM